MLRFPMQRKPIRYPIRQQRRDQEVVMRDLKGLKVRQSRGEARTTEEWRTAALEEGTGKTDGNQKEKRKRTVERTSLHPRRHNANQPATLQEKRGSLRCIPGSIKGVQEGLGGWEEKGTRTKRDWEEKGTRTQRDWEDGRRRVQEPRGSGRTGKEGERKTKRKPCTRQYKDRGKIPSSREKPTIEKLR
ncbi:hypothetical protein NDU88_004642 [Pleurodeles waltl]|uniref:Uncharacterized protein n=1 Tax=Pleurodeles waltl TaxID=8319 RepID=A0AAV7VJD4_PLEWA|nr:hypothetical protein NDU88_004642 [Pleurodeles waltl]